LVNFVYFFGIERQKRYRIPFFEMAVVDEKGKVKMSGGKTYVARVVRKIE